MNIWLRRTAAFLVAAAVTTLLGTVLQTQFNLAALAALGAPVAMETRLDVTLLDLAGFAPLFGVITVVALLVAFLATGLLRRWATEYRTGLYALAGCVGIAAALLIMEAALGLTAIAAARSVPGFAVLVACGAVGGWVFARVSKKGGQV